MVQRDTFRRRGQASTVLGLRVGLSLLALTLIYLLVIRGSANDPLAWFRQLPDNDPIALDVLRSGLEEELNRKLLDDYIRMLRGEDPNKAVRKLNEFVIGRFPELRYAVAGSLARRGEELLNHPGKEQIAINLAQSATAMAEDDWRPWSSLSKIYGQMGKSDQAREAEERSRDLLLEHPVVRAHNYAIGALAPFFTVAAIWFLVGYVSRPQFRSRVPLPPGPETQQALAAPRPPPSEIFRPAPTPETTSPPPASAPPPDPGEGPTSGPGQITKVLGAEERLEQAMLLLEEGQWEDALPVLHKAVQLNPALTKKVAALCVVSGKRLYDQSKTEEAERAFQTAADFDPNDIRAHTYLANCMVKRGDYARAVEHYLHVCSLEPQGAIGFYNLGICYEKTKQMDNAIKGFQHALTLDPKMANAHFYLAKIFEGLKKREDAIRHWKACLDIAPGTPQAQRAEQRLAALVKQPPA